MVGSEAATVRPPPLMSLTRGLIAHEEYRRLIAHLGNRDESGIEGPWGSACALVAAALLCAAPRTLVVVLPRPNDLDDFCDDFPLFASESPQRYPAWEGTRADRVIGDWIYADRLRTLKQSLSGTAPRLIVTCFTSLQQPAPAVNALRASTRTLTRGATVDVQELTNWLSAGGCAPVTAVQMPGEYSWRGGILDIFAPDSEHPMRIELFGDEMESLRSFEVATQRSVATLAQIEITLVPQSLEEHTHLSAYLPRDSWWLLVEPEEASREGARFAERSPAEESVFSVADVWRPLAEFGRITLQGVAGTGAENTWNLQLRSLDRFGADVQQVRQELDQMADGQQVHVVCPTAAEIERLEELFADTTLQQQQRLHFVAGHLRQGFQLTDQGVIVISSAELFHRTDRPRPPARHVGRPIDSFLELREGDLVVHLGYGIGRYRGLKLLSRNQQMAEYLEVEFREGTRVYVPATHIDLVQKYVGGGKARIQLAKVGSKTWARQKQAAESAVGDMAADLLQLQAIRQQRPGITFLPDTPWQREFDASFPYQETRDQLSAIEAIKADMQSPRPMDRLLCGDVGFGKTEVAMRAAFKAVDNGYQVAVLVPTTILAEQHYRSFQERLAEYPFRIARLSRFCTAAEQRQIVEGLTDGTIDIVIGTHRLASHDVQFQNLGLVIIDEEQRFGVEIKERLKALRAVVDILTMTATPIPRTLHLSMTGLRDISNLETPPEDRVAVQTQVLRWHEETIRQAILRELNRDGQVYFIHNRVHDIETIYHRLMRIVPEARIRIGHGQMAESELEKVMVDFVDHKFDLLLATTIVESGLDIPNANTILIDESDRYGLADLHQLRGRVGRYKHRAHCYLLVDSHKYVTPNAARRLRAIEEYSQMGAGFAIAMRDLEFRGAGNILGTEQSGHIAAVGYELYCQLLDAAVRRLQHLPPSATLDVAIELPGDVYLPADYVSDVRSKFDLYRRFNRVATHEQVAELAVELQDRFGPLPATTMRLIEWTRLKVAATAWDIESLLLEDDFLVLRFRDRTTLEPLVQHHAGRLRVVDHRSAYWRLSPDARDPDALLETARRILQIPGATSAMGAQHAKRVP